MVGDEDPRRMEKRKGERDGEDSRFGKFIPWFPGLGALIVLLILRACGLFSS